MKYGRERYQELRIKLNNRNQASENWLKFLRKFSLQVKPEALDRINGGIFRYQYSNRDKSICIWTQHRPDQNTIRPGSAGTAVVRVEETAPVPFSKVRSTLVKTSNVPPTFTRMSRGQLRELSNQLVNQSNPVTVSDLVPHAKVLDDMEDSSFDTLEDFGKHYQERRHGKEVKSMDIFEISAKLQEAGVKHVLVAADEATALQIHYKSAAERAKERRKAKQYRLKNKSKLKMKRKKYEQKMKHRKPNALRSQRMKLISKHYNH